MASLLHYLVRNENLDFKQIKSGELAKVPYLKKSILATSYGDLPESLSEAYSYRIREDYEKRGDGKQYATMKATADRVKQMKRDLRMNDTMTAVLGMLGLVIAMAEYEIFISEEEGKPIYTTSNFGNTLRALVTGSTVVVLLLILRHARIKYNLDCVLKKNTDPQTLAKKYMTTALVESLMMVVHVPPFFAATMKARQLDQEVFQSINGFIMVAMLMRLYLIFRLLAQFSKWTTDHAAHCCELVGSEADTYFAVKALLKERAYFILGITLFVSIFAYGYAVRVFELPIYIQLDNSADGFQDFSFVWNGMWLVIVTMTTVGYGDLFAKTHLGRIVCCFACFTGVFLISLLVVALTNSASFDSKENRAYDILYRLHAKDEIKKKTAAVFLNALKLNHLKIMYQRGLLDRHDYAIKRSHLFYVMEISMQVLSDTKIRLMNYDIPAEEILRQLREKIDRDLNEIRKLLNTIDALETNLDQIEKKYEYLQTNLQSIVSDCINLQDMAVRLRFVPTSPRKRSRNSVIAND